jgi:glycosyltransferase involved in cell wall biosynthesis
VLAGPEMPNFRAFWRRFGPKNKVARLGVLRAQQKRDFFAGIDVHALPSQTDSFGLVLLEAWANSKPNIVYRAGGPAELVRHGGDGFVVRCGDVEQFAARLGELAVDVDLRTSLGQRGRERIAREFCWEDKLELVHRVLRGFSPRLEDDEVHVPVRLEDVQHRPPFITRRLDRGPKRLR